MLFMYCFVWPIIKNLLNGVGLPVNVNHSPISLEIFICVKKKTHYFCIPDVM